MKLTFYGGANEVGGNKILLEDKSTRVFLDFGIPYTRWNEYFEFPLLKPANIDDLFKTGILPQLKGLYRYNALRVRYDQDGPASIEGTDEEREFDAVLLSHAHKDHWGYIGVLRGDIPIFMSEITKKIIQLNSRIGIESWNEVTSHLSLKELGRDTNQPIGNLTVERFDVDHSVMGASAYIIEGSKTIVYTGDFRCHGKKKHYSEEFINAAKNKDVDYLLCEGTRIAKPKGKEERKIEKSTLNSEEGVKKECIEIVSEEDNLVLYDASATDIERARILWEVAQKTGRTLVIDSRVAFLLLCLNEGKQLVHGLPQIKDVKIVLPRSKLPKNAKSFNKLVKACAALENDENCNLYMESFKERRQKHEKEMVNNVILDNLLVWGPELRGEILENPREYIIYTSNGPLTLLHFKLMNKCMSGTYIYGKAEPFNEEMDFTFERLLKWLDLCDLNFEYAHTSGHCPSADLKRAIEEIHPRYVIPIHTENADKFGKIVPKGVKVLYPQINGTI